MTRIIYSVLSLLIFAMGVFTFDHWGNMVNIPEDNLEEIQEMQSMFPVRHIRFEHGDKACDCDGEKFYSDFGQNAYPRFLTNTKCKNRTCVDLNRCEEVPFFINVSVFKEANTYHCENGDSQLCLSQDLWRNEQRKVTVACVTVKVKKQKKIIF